MPCQCRPYGGFEVNIDISVTVSGKKQKDKPFAVKRLMNKMK